VGPHNCIDLRDLVYLKLNQFKLRLCTTDELAQAIQFYDTHIGTAIEVDVNLEFDQDLEEARNLVATGSTASEA
jgi:regulator of sigma D